MVIHGISLKIFSRNRTIVNHITKQASPRNTESSMFQSRPLGGRNFHNMNFILQHCIMDILQLYGGKAGVKKFQGNFNDCKKSSKNHISYIAAVSR